MTVIEKTNVIPEGNYTIDASHSSAAFAVRHTASTFRGGFKEIDGRLEAADGQVKLTGSAKVDSIDVDDENIRPHLLSPEFFDCCFIYRARMGRSIGAAAPDHAEGGG